MSKDLKARGGKGEEGSLDIWGMSVPNFFKESKEVSFAGAERAM